MIMCNVSQLHLVPFSFLLQFLFVPKNIFVHYLLLMHWTCDSIKVRFWCFGAQQYTKLFFLAFIL